MISNNASKQTKEKICNKENFEVLHFFASVQRVFIVSAADTYHATNFQSVWTLKDTSLIRTVSEVPIVYNTLCVQINLWNKDTSLMRTHFLGPVVSTTERPVPVYTHTHYDKPSWH